tara:strand:+ start:1690 stop:2313 length:624 start_codon:yes stop_codon:yes gene_type:complete
MRVENGVPVGVPHLKPQKIEIKPGVVVGCGHWPQEELAKYGEYPCPKQIDPSVSKEVGYQFNDALGICEALVEPIPVAEKIDVALSKIDAEAEEMRQAVITPGDGQAMSYQAKADEAKQCLAAYSTSNLPPEGAFLLLESEVGILAKKDGSVAETVFEIAEVVEMARTEWVRAEAAINRVRLQAKADIRNAKDASEVELVMASVVWP